MTYLRHMPSNGYNCPKQHTQPHFYENWGDQVKAEEADFLQKN